MTMTANHRMRVTTIAGDSWFVLREGNHSIARGRALNAARKRRLRLFPCGLLWLATALIGTAGTLTQNFATNPLAGAWQVYGNTNLFHWNATNLDLEVTWDSSQTNSYFRLPLGTVLDRNDDFSLTVNAQFSDITGGVNPAKTFTFELAFGLQNFAAAGATNFFRGNGHESPDLAEFDYFPAAGLTSATVWPSFWSTNGVLSYNAPSDYTLISLPLGVPLLITVSYTASNHVCVTTITTNGVSIGPIGSLQLSPSFTDFFVDTFAIASYSDTGQNPADSGSLLAHGVITSVAVTVPPPPVQNLASGFTAGQWQVQFTSRTNWLYTLQRAGNLKTWTGVSPVTPGTGTGLTLADTNAPAGEAFYRVLAAKP